MQGVRTSPPPPEMTCRFLIQLVFRKKIWSIGVGVIGALPPGSAPECLHRLITRYTLITRQARCSLLFSLTFHVRSCFLRCMFSCRGVVVFLDRKYPDAKFL